MDKLIKEIENLFGTTAKDNVIYFNDVTCNTPIPLPVVEAVKAIADEYPDLGVQIGTYSVKVLNQNVRPVRTEQPINNSANKEIESSKVGNIHDNYIIGRLPKEEAIKQLEENGFENAEIIVDKWGSPVKSSKSIKSSLSDFFPVSEEDAEDLNDLAETFTSKSDLRSVLEDYFHIYDDLAEMSVQEFDTYLADYFNSETHPED